MKPQQLIPMLVGVCWHVFVNLCGAFGFTPVEGGYAIGALAVVGLVTSYVKARRQQALWSLDDDRTAGS